jgi:uncharacterized protein YnzC (UPF0291/DUF896 family)
MSLELILQELILLFKFTNQVKLKIESIEIIDEDGNKIIVK